jgi:cytochrome c-type biogenesis protein CcsB
MTGSMTRFEERTVSESLSGFDDRLMFSAIVFYALALLAFAARTALRNASVPTGSTAARAVLLGERQVGSPSPRAATAVLPSRTTPSQAGGGGPRRSRAERAERSAVALTTSAVALHAGAVIARGLEAGRAPWGNMYEYASGVALAAALGWLLMTRRQLVRYLGTWVVGAVVLTLGLAVTVLYAPADELVPALNSYWLVIHVAAAIIAGGVFTLGAAASVLYLVRIRADRRGRPGGRAASLPTAASLDKVTYSATLFAFPVWTFAVIAGAIWAEDAWGRYWGWDPKETWAFITWVLYAAYLHAGATAGWRGRRAQLLALAGYVSFVFNFFGVNMWITGLHSYAGV